MAEKGPICKDEKLGEEVKRLFFELADSLEKQLKEQAKMGFDTEKALKAVRKAKRYVRKLVS